MKPRIVVLTGAGISAESGLKTFRGADGLWEGYAVEDVATPEAYERDPELVLRFYNERRAQCKAVSPNAAHLALAELEAEYDVHIITQNVDDLHERAGSTQILHLHGQLNQARSDRDEGLILDWTEDIELGDLAPDGAQLRPHIVWFGETVPMIVDAARLCTTAEILMVVGTSLVVYPANTLVDYAPIDTSIYVVDPERPGMAPAQATFIQEPASVGVPQLVEKLLAERIFARQRSEDQQG